MCVCVAVVAVVVVDTNVDGVCVVVVDDDDVLGVFLNRFLFRVNLHKIPCITGKDSILVHVMHSGTVHTPFVPRLPPFPNRTHNPLVLGILVCPK